MAEITDGSSATAVPKGRELEQVLAAGRQRFLSFVRARVSDPMLAEDILQDALLRALRSLGQVRDEERLVPWFYQILRNGIVDAYRRRDVQHKQVGSLPDERELPEEPSEDDEAALCECFRQL